MNLTQKYKIKKSDTKKYAFVEKRDYVILSKIYKLEKFDLIKSDKDLVKFIRTQLKRDWRALIIKLLNKLLKKYS